jgi:flagellar hook-associated protein 2
MSTVSTTSSATTATTTFSGLATGLDTDSIVTKLMAIERYPITRLQAKKTAEADRLAAYTQFKGTIDDLKSAVSAMNLTSQVKSTSVSLSANAPFTATSTNASSGSYNIAVKQLAQIQKSISNGVTSQTDAVLGTGTFTITGKTNLNITVDSTNNSLSGLAAAINAKTTDTGVKATIINDGSTGTGATPYHLVLTGTDSGAEFTVTNNLSGGTEGTALDALADDPYQKAQQAEVYIDGIKIVSNNNIITSAISGVTLNLNATSEADPTGTPPYKTSLLTVATDTSALKEKLTTFVASYNKVMNWILSGYPEFSGTTTKTTDTEKTDLLGSVLRGDSSINEVKRGLQSILSSVTKTSGSLSVLSQLGITTNLDGTLAQNNTKMDAALQDNFDSTVSLLAGEGSTDGVMKKINYYLLNLTNGSTGMYAGKKKSYDQIVARIDDQIANMEPRMTKKEATLRAQFSAMETLVSGLNSQSTFLTQQMDLLSNMLKGK